MNTLKPSVVTIKKVASSASRYFQNYEKLSRAAGGEWWSNREAADMGSQPRRLSSYYCQPIYKSKSTES